MVNKRIIFIIPGFRQRVTNCAYKEIAKTLKKQGYAPVLVSIPWKNSTISENVEYFLKKYNRYESCQKYILGFSYGAMIAFIASTKVRVSGLMLCSLSPYFREDLPKTRQKAQSVLMEQRYKDFAQFHCGTLAKRIKTKNILMLYGDQEAKALIKRVTNAFGQIQSTKKQLISISRTEHAIGSRRYLKTIHRVAQILLDLSSKTI